MFKASRARRLAKRQQKRANKAIIDRILKCVRSAALRGNRRCGWNMDLEKSVVDTLTKMGYHVRPLEKTSDNGCRVIISW